MFSINAAIMNLSFIWNISEDRAGQLIGLSTLPFPIVVRSQVISFVSSTHIFTKIFSFCFLQISEVKKSKEKCPLLSHFFHSLTHSLPLTSSFSPPHSLFLSLILSPSFSISLSLLSLAFQYSHLLVFSTTLNPSWLQISNCCDDEENYRCSHTATTTVNVVIVTAVTNTPLIVTRFIVTAVVKMINSYLKSHNYTRTRIHPSNITLWICIFDCCQYSVYQARYLLKQFFPGYRRVINFRPSAQPLK